MTLQEFISKWNNKYCDFDNAYGAQCVDLARQFWKEVANITQPKSVRGACDFWTSYPTDPALNSYYNRIDNAPNNHPNPGDIVLWDNKAGGGYGHIAICIKADANSFTSFDQNYPVGSPCSQWTHNYTHVFGWFTPKGASMGTTVQVPSDTFEELVRKSTALDEHQKTPCISVADHNAQMANKQAEIDILYKRIDELEAHVCPTTPDDGWKMNGKTITIVEGSKTTTYNYTKE